MHPTITAPTVVELGRREVGSVILILEAVYYIVWIAYIVYKWVQGRRNPTPVVEYRPVTRVHYRRRIVRKALAYAIKGGVIAGAMAAANGYGADWRPVYIEDMAHAIPYNPAPAKPAAKAPRAATATRKPAAPATQPAKPKTRYAAPWSPPFNRNPNRTRWAQPLQWNRQP